MTLSSGWRLLTPGEYVQFDLPAKDPSICLAAVAKTRDEGKVPIFVAAGGALSADANDDEAYADTIRQVEEVLLGSHLIDDLRWPILSEEAR